MEVISPEQYIRDIFYFETLSNEEKNEVMSSLLENKEILKKNCLRKISKEGPNFVWQSFFLFLLSLPKKNLELEIKILSLAFQRKFYS